ncbi:MAG TPA: hypothetical protein VMN04_10610 [Thermoanaerobaculia bacterium]|nr:hypothetical protein [Thermoanaerobaculia bacterium]
MRTTTRIDDVLLDALREKARREKTPLTQVLNRVLRSGLASSRTPARRRRHREKAFSMGKPSIDLRKALAAAARLEDEEVLRKLALRK